MTGGFISFLTGTFISKYYFGSMLNLACIYMTAASGAAFCIKAGEFNLGGEGQIYLGGFTAAVILNRLEFLPAIPAMLISFTGAAAVAAITAMISALLKKFRNVDFLLTSFLLSAAVIPVIDALVAGPFRGSTENLLATPFIQQKFRFGELLPPSPLNTSASASVIVCAVSFIVMNRTEFGRKLQLYGISPEFSKYSGIRQGQVLVPAALISGALHGAAGFFAVCGTYFTCHSGFYGGMGWSALSCAIIAKANPLAIIHVSAGLSWLTTSADRTALTSGLNFDLSGLIQAVVLIMTAMPAIAHRKRPHRAKI